VTGVQQIKSYCKQEAERGCHIHSSEGKEQVSSQTRLTYTAIGIVSHAVETHIRMQIASSRALMTTTETKYV